ncbi:MAG: CD3324 family protein [Clostridium sp.]|uniref:CD3324 family protein n=1 Tax=Clostridium sp. TaxID=1506 RepID=UPI003D6D4EFC
MSFVNYVNAGVILPDNLVVEIQKYIQGGYLYVPSQGQTRKKWGENSGNRDFIKNRNQDICVRHKKGYTIKVLAKEFFLSIDSIKKIVYTKGS